MSEEPVRLDANRSALIIQDLQNDVIGEGVGHRSNESARNNREYASFLVTVFEKTIGDGRDQDTASE